MSSLRKTIWRRGARGLICLTVLLGMVAAVVPLPVGTRSRPDKDRSQPFPCQNRPCGCRSADQCWKKCCCFSNTQKVAWAKANRVKPPEFVVQAATEEQPQVACHPKSCCSKVATPQPKLDSKLRSESPAESTAARSDHGRTASQKPLAEKARATTYVLGAMAQQCQGIGWSWSAVPAVILPVDWKLPSVMEVCIATVIPCSETYPRRTLLPPEPPPRWALDRFFPV